jgi:hypothetical protein
VSSNSGKGWKNRRGRNKSKVSKRSSSSHLLMLNLKSNHLRSKYNLKNR